MFARASLRVCVSALLWVLTACNGRTSEGAPSAPTSTPPVQHLLLVVQHDLRGFHVRDSRVVDGPVPTSRVAKDEPWRIDVEGGSATRLYSAGLRRQGELRGEFAGQDGGIQAVHLTPENFSFVVRVPLLSGAQRIRFWNEPASGESTGGVELGSVAYPAVSP
jgi:hypothetical protein